MSSPLATFAENSEWPRFKGGIEDLRVWILLMENRAKMLKLSTPLDEKTDLAIIALELLDGKAKSFFFGQERQEMTWSAFKTLMRSHFESGRTEVDARRELRGISASRFNNIEAFGKRVVELSKRIPSYQDADIVDDFLFGVKDDLQVHLRGMMISNDKLKKPDELIRYAAECEKINPRQYSFRPNRAAKFSSRRESSERRAESSDVDEDGDTKMELAVMAHKGKASKKSSFKNDRSKTIDLSKVRCHRCQKIVRNRSQCQKKAQGLSKTQQCD